MNDKRPLNTCRSISTLGFGQLNDLLFVIHFPEIAQEFVASPSLDERELIYFRELSHKHPFNEFGVESFILEVERRIAKLASQWSFWRQNNKQTKALVANLCWIAYAVERWSQSVLRRPAGEAVKSLRLGRHKKSLHDFLVSRLGNYNTLEHFALRSVGSIEGVRKFAFIEGSLHIDGIHLLESSYTGSKLSYKPCVSRFPSTLDMQPFLEVIKKGELVAQMYNDLAIQLIEAISREGLDSETAMDLARSVALGMRIGRQSILDFLGDNQFTTKKFIHVLRQFTIELEESPASLLLQRFNLEAHERIGAIGFLNHYLQPGTLNSRSRGLVLWDWLRNEMVELPSVGVWLNTFESLSVDSRIDLCRKHIGPIRHRSHFPLLFGAVTELISSGRIGAHRILYALELFKKLIPRVASITSKIAGDVPFLRHLQSRLLSSHYTLAPSGANSLAFFGGDTLLGLSDQIPNYRTHLLNRLPIMIANDRRRFWNFVDSDFPGLPSLIYRALFGLASWSSNGGKAPLNIVPRLTADKSSKAEKYLPYFEIFHSFADLSKAHNASVEKFLRRVAQRMPRGTKERLLSSPDHGTTFMQPAAIRQDGDQRLSLPSLDKLNHVRALNQQFALSFSMRGLNHRDQSPEYYRSFFV